MPPLGVGARPYPYCLFECLERLPRVLGVESGEAPAVYRAWGKGDVEGPARGPEAAPADSMADSISVGVPRNWRRAVRAIQESGGEMILVSDDEIEEAMRTPARLGIGSAHV